MSEHGIDRRGFMKTAVASGAGLGLGAASSRTAAAAEGELLSTIPRRELGRTGETIPILFMGGSQPFNPKYDKMLHRAHKLGMNYIDCAEDYAEGQSHRGVKTFIEQIERKNVWITSKRMAYGPAATVENFKEGLDTCLEELGTDYLDAYFIHGVKSEHVLEPDFIKMGDDLRKSGKTRFYGFSCHDGNVPELMEKAARVGGIDMIMFRYNFRQYGDMKLNKAIDACVDAGIGLMGMKAQGLSPEDAKVAEFQSKNFSPPQAKLKAIWADERISGCVSGMLNLQMLEENSTAALSPAQLTMNEFMQLNKLAALTAAHYCNGCSHICEGRIDGDLKVADALRHLMYYDSYGDPETARRLYNALSHGERDFENVDLRAATSACPQGIDIAHRLAEAKRYLLA